MKPWKPKLGIDGCTAGTVTLLFCNIGFTTGTDRLHHRACQFHHRARVLNLSTGFPDAPQTRLQAAGEASCRKAMEVLPSVSTGFGESRRNAPEGANSCLQVSRSLDLVSGGRRKRSMSMFKGMALRMHQPALTGGL